MNTHFPASTINVVIADDHSIFRKGLVAALDKYSHIAIIAQAENGKDLVDKLENNKTDIVITDIHMPKMDGIEATSIITKRFPQTRVIALTMYDKEDIIKQILKAGAKAYLLKNSEESEIVHAIQAVYQNDYYYCNSTVSKMMNSTEQRTSKGNSSLNFTKKELSVIELVCKQHCNKEIASKLGVTVRSVESAKERIQTKTGARNMVGIVLYAIKNMMISVNDLHGFN